MGNINEESLIRRVEKLLNESGIQIYNVEYNYGDGSPGLAIGHVKVRANSEEEALEKAEKYASNRHYRDDSYYIEDSCKIVKSGYSNDPIIESSQKSEDLSKHPKLKDVWSRWKFNTKYGLHYTSNAKDTQAYLAKITKPNTFWLEDEDTGEAIVQGTPKDLINFMLKHKDKIDESSQKNEDLQLVDKADPDFQLGDAYIAKNKEDLINSLDKLTLGDTIGAFVNYLDEDSVTGELNVEMADEDLFKISMEEYTKENADDWEGKDVLDTEFLTKEETIYQLNLILEHWEIVDKIYESIDQDLKSSLKTYLDQTEGKFEDIPDRNNVDWKNVSDNAINDYQRLGLQLFNKKKAHDSFAYSVVKSVLDNNLDGAVIDWIKVHMEETPEISKALKEFDNALQEKDLTKSWKAYQNLWDVHRNATKRKYNKKDLNESLKEDTKLNDICKLVTKLYGPMGPKKGQYNLIHGGKNAPFGIKLVKELSGKGATKDILVAKDKQELMDKLTQQQNNKNESVTYHFSVEDIGISGNNWIFPEEAYKEAKSRLSKLGYKVSDLTDDLEFTVIGDSTGVVYDGVIYSKEDVNESISEGNLDEIYKVLDYYMAKLGFNLVEDRKPYFINKKYIKADNTNYIHYIDFTPQMDNDQLKYEVRDEKGRQKLCNTYNILDAVDMDTSLKLIEFDMEGLE